MLRREKKKTHLDILMTSEVMQSKAAVIIAILWGMISVTLVWKVNTEYHRNRFIWIKYNDIFPSHWWLDQTYLGKETHQIPLAASGYHDVMNMDHQNVVHFVLEQIWWKNVQTWGLSSVLLQLIIDRRKMSVNYLSRVGLCEPLLEIGRLIVFWGIPSYWHQYFMRSQCFLSYTLIFFFFFFFKTALHKCEIIIP